MNAKPLPWLLGVVLCLGACSGESTDTDGDPGDDGGEPASGGTTAMTGGQSGSGGLVEPGAAGGVPGSGGGEPEGTGGAGSGSGGALGPEACVGDSTATDCTEACPEDTGSGTCQGCNVVLSATSGVYKVRLPAVTDLCQDDAGICTVDYLATVLTSSTPVKIEAAPGWGIASSPFEACANNPPTCFVLTPPEEILSVPLTPDAEPGYLTITVDDGTASCP